MASEADWGRCTSCGSRVADGDGVQVEIRQGNTIRTTVLCPDCASLACTACGSPVDLTGVLDEAQLAGGQVGTCNRCEEQTLLDDMVEIRNRNDPNYRKRVCGECLDEIAVPTEYRVIRELSDA